MIINNKESKKIEILSAIYDIKLLQSKINLSSHNSWIISYRINQNLIEQGGGVISEISYVAVR